MIGCGGCVINIVSKFGAWIERHWPEQMTTEDVKKYYDSLFNSMAKNLDTHLELIQTLTKITDKLQSEIETLKTQTTVKSRIAGSTPSTMTPFATKFPINGGNQSPR